MPAWDAGEDRRNGNEWSRDTRYRTGVRDFKRYGDIGLKNEKIRQAGTRRVSKEDRG